MGKPRYIYFTDENDEQLSKELNKSQLINQLLNKHYKKNDIKSMSADDLRKAIETAKIKKEYETKLEELNNGRK